VSAVEDQLYALRQIGNGPPGVLDCPGTFVSSNAGAQIHGRQPDRRGGRPLHTGVQLDIKSLSGESTDVREVDLVHVASLRVDGRPLTRSETISRRVKDVLGKLTSVPLRWLRVEASIAYVRIATRARVLNPRDSQYALITPHSSSSLVTLEAPH
jgi:hypothetical protein